MVHLSRNLLALLLFLVSVHQLRGQDYTPMNFENGIWLINSFGSGGYNAEEQFYCLGDTTVNDTIYKKLFISSHSYSADGGRDTIIKDYIGAIAEIPKKTIRYIPNGDVISDIIYDFDIDLGDTIKCVFNDIVIRSIDSIEICGNYHKRYIQDLGNWPITLTEGIGFSNGLLGYYEFNLGGGESTTTLECYFEPNNPNCDQCPFLLYFEEAEAEAETTIYPNPAYDHINIESSKPISRVVLFDLHGKSINELRVQYDTSLKIDLSEECRASMYFVVIHFKNGTFCTRKISKISK